MIVKRLLPSVPPFGQYEWLRLPFGLKSSPARFCLMLSTVLKGCEDFCGMYIDDLLVFSDSWEDHVRHISELFTRFETAGLTVKLSKCFFGCAQIEYLGHVVGEGRVSPGDLKVKALLDAPPPRNKRQLRSFLGL